MTAQEVIDELRAWAWRQQPIADERSYAEINAKGMVLDDLEAKLDEIEGRQHERGRQPV